MSSSTEAVQTFDEREQLVLAPYAMFSGQSRGRKHPEATHAYRSPFQRDRDRIVHSAAFRRLSGKMQVFTGDMGDYHRTRLTHTQEVASIARTIGRTLRLNEDLIEALALFHDIGHPPYGHAGEDALNGCLSHQGGFSHNQFALTVAEHLESRYVSFPGLNLSLEVLDGQSTRVAKERDGRILEVQVVDLADSATYDAHDTDDAVKLGLVDIEDMRPLALIGDLLKRVQNHFGQLDPKQQRKALVHELIDRQVTDVLTQAARDLQDHDFRSADEVKQSGFQLRFSAELSQQKAELERFLYQTVYRHPKLIEVREHAQQRLRFLFAQLQLRPQRLPQKFQDRAESVGIDRAIGEYLAGMTDRFCDRQFVRLSMSDHA